MSTSLIVRRELEGKLKRTKPGTDLWWPPGVLIQQLCGGLIHGDYGDGVSQEPGARSVAVMPIVVGVNLNL